MKHSLFSLILLVSANAFAVPNQYTTQGRLLDADGLGLDDEIEMTFRMMDSASGGAAVWEETLTVGVANGFYTATLGQDEEGNPLDLEVLNAWPLWVEVQLDGESPMSPRMEFNSVPYAVAATMAEELSGGPVDATTIAVGGTVVIDGDGNWVGPEISGDTTESTVS